MKHALLAAVATFAFCASALTQQDVQICDYTVMQNVSELGAMANLQHKLNSEEYQAYRKNLAAAMMDAKTCEDMDATLIAIGTELAKAHYPGLTIDFRTPVGE